MYFADDAIICTNPELSSCRDSDKMVGFIASKAKGAAELGSGVQQKLLITRYDAARVIEEDSLSVEVRISTGAACDIYMIIPRILEIYWVYLYLVLSLRASR